ncbi:MAG: YfhO family protein [Ferruginibacter sp.]
MKNFNFKSLVPHLIAIGVFLIVALIISKPALESGVILKQSDMTGWHGMSHQSFIYKETHGHFPLWITSMFGGMPAYQVAMEGAWSPLGFIDHLFQLWLPQPMNFFFLACISFYFMCICMRIKPLAAIAGAIAFAFCSFSPIIITAGHETQMFALAYTPAVIGAVMLIFRGMYVSGFTLTALFTALQIGQGHQQISYYLLLILGAMTLAWIVTWIKEKNYSHLSKALGLLLAAGILGVAINALTLLTIYDYAKESKRGGQLVLDETNNTQKLDKESKTSGLSREYAFQWSYGKGETLSLMFPGVMAYGNHYAERDGESYIFPELKEDANVLQVLSEKLNLPGNAIDQMRMQLSQSLYWGEQPFTNGPIYLGAIVCMLFILGMFILDDKQKWWIFILSVLSIFMAWGSHFPGFNNFLFDYMPFYNKFRVPTMTLVIPQVLFAIMTALTLDKLVSNSDEDTWKKFRYAMMATGVVFLGALAFYSSSSFASENTQRTQAFNNILDQGGANAEQQISALDAKFTPEKDNRLYEGLATNLQGTPEARKTSREAVSALRQDRKAIFMSDIIRSFLFVLVAAICIVLYLKKKMMATLMMALTSLFILIDLMGFDLKYLNGKSFDSKDKYESSEFPFTAADQVILNDKDPNFRVFNLAGGDPFQESKTSYYHKSIGGYHAAKMGIYDDLAAYQMSGQPNMQVLNMLNAKYILQRQGNEIVPATNTDALGHAWFVKGARFVEGPAAEMRALYNFSAKDTAIVENQYKDIVGNYTPADSSATIVMTAFDNDAIVYESNSSAPHLALFSEIYYKDWYAYIDGKKVPYFKANYVLRGLNIPAGKHKIDFKFEPATYWTGRTISSVSTWILMILLLGFIWYEWKGKEQLQNKFS